MTTPHTHRPHLRRPLLAFVAILAALAGSGCAGISDPYQATTSSRTAAAAAASGQTVSTPADSGDPAGERGGTIPATTAGRQQKLSPGAGAPTPQAAIARYTSLWVNWTAGTIPAQERQLAQISLSQARAQALQAAASLQNDTQLIQSQVSNTGSLIAAAPGQGPAAGKWVVVTEETTSGRGDYQGLPPAVHMIYAQLTHTSQGWVITARSAQN